MPSAWLPGQFVSSVCWVQFPGWPLEGVSVAKVPQTSATAYAASTDLVKYYDARQIGDWVADDDTRVTDLANSSVVSALLKAASGWVESACGVGGRYTPDDLNALTGVGQEFLKELVCTIAVYLIMRRRRILVPDGMRGDIERAFKTLEELRSGASVFGFVEVAAAGVGTTTNVVEDAKMPTEIYPRWLGVTGHDPGPLES